MTGNDFRRTKIIATLGPSSCHPAMVQQLVEAGVNVFRINLSHAGSEQLAEWTQLVRAVERRCGRHVAVMADLQGPKLRVGELVHHGPIHLSAGARVEITTANIVGDERRIATTYQYLPRDVKPGDRILLDDGRIELRVDTVADGKVETTVVNGGELGEHKGMNLPGVRISAPTLTDKDREDIVLACRAGVDVIAQSFVRSADDVREAKAAVAAAGGAALIVAKIEKPEAVEALEAILDVADAVMVARGDLGVELPPERVPTLQKRIIQRARAHLIPVITATQMLESMIRNPRPTRAEASDVANAIIDGTDAIMLSGETAVGAYPLQAVETMVRIALEVERSFPPVRERRRSDGLMTDAQAISQAALSITEAMNVQAIAAFTRSGFSARIVSKDRPAVPVYAFVPDETIARRLALSWAVYPCVVDFGKSTDELTAAVEEKLLHLGAVTPGQAVVLVGGTPLGVQGRTNFLKIIRPG